MITEEPTVDNYLRPEQEFWIPQPMKESILLTALRIVVLDHNPQRCPKWHFRFDDLVIQLQPRAEPSIRTNYALFQGIALQGSPITLDAFKQHGSGLNRMSFTIGTKKNDFAWRLSPTGLRGMNPGAALTFRNRVLESLSQLEQLDPANMFRPACLVCGKKLTDPVSMARWRGPECAHTTSLNVGFWRVPVENAA